MFRLGDDENYDADKGRDRGGEELCELPLELIERRISEYAAKLAAGSCRLLELIAEFDRRSGWAGSGCLSCADWVAWQCSVSPHTAREYVRVARCLAELPLTQERFSRGELSYSKVRALTRVASADSERDLLELAGNATAAQIERVFRTFRRVTPDEARITGERAYMGWAWDDDGSLVVRARLAPEDGATLLRALDAARDGLWEERREGAADADETAQAAGVPAGTQSIPQMGGNDVPAGTSASTAVSVEAQTALPRITNLEAFNAMTEATRTRGPTTIASSAASSGGDRYLVSVFVDAATLSHDADGRCHIDNGPALAPETARKLSCDASLVRVLESEGKLLALGRKTRTIPPALRRGLMIRDGGCRFPGCNRKLFVEAHHLKHWAHGGETSLENTALFCDPHHDFFHEGGWTVEGNPNERLVFRNRYGVALPPSPPLGPVSAEDLAPAPGSLSTGSGERMNLGYCVDAVIDATA